MGRYEILKINTGLWAIIEEGKIIFKLPTLDQAHRRVEQLEYVDFLRENLNPY